MGILRTSGWSGNEDQIYENIILETMFRTRCAIPCIVQSYNEEQNTVECQPAIREKIIAEDASVSYQQIPLLLNVPVVFPGNSLFELKFPIQQGDECLVIFSDLPIDNFWVAGNVQNPVESRRHDLSDGIAIPCNLSIPKVTAEAAYGIEIDSKGEIILRTAEGTITSSQLYSLIHNHYHRVTTSTGNYDTGSPLGV
mgnify:FL=1